MTIQDVAPHDLPGVLASTPGPLVVVFHADWCGYCARFEPVVEKRAPGLPARVVRVDISDEEHPLWDALAIEYVPTVMVFREGKPVARVGGILREQHLEKVLAEGGLTK
ncbi:MAG TPA: thioredoxin family protein [Candidatus Thermoplasmatota archaeon]|nr:thioredoxin family protein [Candidatus Thermoplasmatota archaeon]